MCSVKARGSEDHRQCLARFQASWSATVPAQGPRILSGYRLNSGQALSTSPRVGPFRAKLGGFRVGLAVYLPSLLRVLNGVAPRRPPSPKDPEGAAAACRGKEGGPRRPPRRSRLAPAPASRLCAYVLGSEGVVSGERWLAHPRCSSDHGGGGRDSWRGYANATRNDSAQRLSAGRTHGGARPSGGSCRHRRPVASG